MKSNGSACPLDQVPVIAFKRVAYLRSYLTEVIQVSEVIACYNPTVPQTLKRAVTILVHKKNSTHDPANFCPITPTIDTVKSVYISST